MIKYCIKVFDSEDRLKYQIVVPKEELHFHLEAMSAFGTVKAFVLDDNEKLM